MYNVKITGIGSYLPDKILTNKDLEKMVDTSDEWITERSGIKERRIAADNELSSDLGAKAAEAALKDAGIEASEIEAIVTSTLSPDMILPATACFIQEKIGAGGAMAFDLTAACTGFTFAFSTAVSYIKSGLFKKVLVVSAECCSKIIDWTDRNMCVLFGDGAGAVVLERTDEEKFMAFDLHSDGKYTDILSTPAGACAIPATYETIDKRMHYMTMDGPKVYKVAVKTMSDTTRNILKSNNLTADDIDYFIPHQANKRIIDSIAKRLKLEEDKVVLTLEKFGNTSSATIPMALCEIYKQGKLKRGNKILFVATGGGFSWGSAIIEY